MKPVKYFKGKWKYVLTDSIHRQLLYVRPKEAVKWMWLSLSLDGLLIIKWGYPSDGPSGPTFDTDATLQGAWVHDALCQLARQGFLDGSDEEVRDQINAEAAAIWSEKGMYKVRNHIWEAMLDTFGDFAMDPENKWEEGVAP